VLAGVDRTAPEEDVLEEQSDERVVDELATEGALESPSEFSEAVAFLGGDADESGFFDGEGLL